MTFPSFSAGEILRATDMNAVGLWLVKSQTVGAGVSSVTVSNAFNASYDAYRILYTGGTVTSNGSISMAFNGSPAGWYGNIVYANFLGGAPLSIGMNNTSAVTFAGGGSAGFAQVLADVQNPFLAQPSWVSANYTDLANAGRTTGYHAVSTSYTGFILTAASGTISGGTIYVYGYQKG